jgi:hypothetical protein
MIPNNRLVCLDQDVGRVEPGSVARNGRDAQTRPQWWTSKSYFGHVIAIHKSVMPLLSQYNV